MNWEVVLPFLKFLDECEELILISSVNAWHNLVVKPSQHRLFYMNSFLITIAITSYGPVHIGYFWGEKGVGRVRITARTLHTLGKPPPTELQTQPQTILIEPIVVVFIFLET
jgi:hypothetical protein